MPAPIRIPRRAHFDLTALPLVRVMESFVHAGRAYTGVQTDLWQYDEAYWSERRGAWAGLPLPNQASAGGLRVVGAARESYDAQGVLDPLDRIASGAILIARSHVIYADGPRSVSAAAHHRLYSCATGEMVGEASYSGDLGQVPDGAYLLWARFFAEWSVLRVVVGDGPWQLAPGVCPSPGASLYGKNDEAPETVITAANEAAFRVVFDPLARCVSASCELEQPLRERDGQFVAPQGALLVGGLRASADGPQSALWVLRDDGTARVIGLQTQFTAGVCECAKINHYCSDLVQAPDGTLFYLTECALFRFDPNADVRAALPGFPLSVGGHPGGNCLRFPGPNEAVHWTEDLTGRDKGISYYYNRIVRRVSGREALGPSTLWHGTNCAEMFLGRLMAMRGQRIAPTLDNPTPSGTLYLDWIAGGQWEGYGGMTRDLRFTFWQRLRALGNKLFVWGYAPAPGSAPSLLEDAHAPAPGDEKNEPTRDEPLPDALPQPTDKPVCAVADGVTLRDADFPFFIRRATVCGRGESARLFVTARAASEGIGPATRVIEITGAKTHLCSHWNPDIAAFTLPRAEFEAAGGDVAQLPPFFRWYPQLGRDGGGVWIASQNAPDAGFYLFTQVGNVSIFFNARPDGALPYDPDLWGRLCFDILADGSVDGPFIEPTCTHAKCAIDAMPPGTRFRRVERLTPDAGAPIFGFQITDMSQNKRLSAERETFPSLWYRIDSEADRADLTSYTHLANYGRLIVPALPAAHEVEAVVLIAPGNLPVPADELPKPLRRA